MSSSKIDSLEKDRMFLISDMLRFGGVILSRLKIFSGEKADDPNIHGEEEEIIDDRRRNKRFEYFVKWHDMVESECSWMIRMNYWNEFQWSNLTITKRIFAIGQLLPYYRDLIHKLSYMPRLKYCERIKKIS